MRLPERRFARLDPLSVRRYSIRVRCVKWSSWPSRECAPKLEISSLGDGAALTGAVSVGLESALGRVFVSRRPAPG